MCYAHSVPKDLTTEVLIQIRDEIKRTNERLERTNERLERIEKRQTESEVRLATELVAVAGAVHELREGLEARSGAAN